MNYPYEAVYCDSDTALYMAARFVQDDYIIVTHPNLQPKRFKNKTEFKQWLEEYNDVADFEYWKKYELDEFTITACAEVKPELEDPVEAGVASFDFFIGRVKARQLAPQYYCVIGGEGNFRYEEAQLHPYKSGRSEKPIMFQQIKDAVIKKYKNRVIIVNSAEADDKMSEIGWQNYLHFKRTGKWKYVLGFIDKDLKMIISPQFNCYTEDEEKKKVVIPTPFEAARCFASQCLTGDATDFIKGLPALTDEIRTKYSIRKANGVGKATAEKLLADCETPTQLFERVVEAYKSYYGVEKVDVVGHRSDTLNWNWLDYLQENANLLWLRRDDKKFEVSEFLTKLGVEYE